MSYDLPDAIILGRSSSIILSISSLNMSNILAVHLSCKQKQSWMKSWLKLCWGKCHQPCGPTLIWPLTKCCVVTMKCIALVTDSRVLFSSFSIWYVLMWCGGTCKRRWVYRRQTKRTETGVGQVLHRLAETRNQFVNIHQKLLHLSDRTCWRHQWRAELLSSSTTHHTPHTAHHTQFTMHKWRLSSGCSAWYDAWAQRRPPVCVAYPSVPICALSCPGATSYAISGRPKTYHSRQIYNLWMMNRFTLEWLSGAARGRADRRLGGRRQPGQDEATLFAVSLVWSACRYRCQPDSHHHPQLSLSRP